MFSRYLFVLVIAFFVSVSVNAQKITHNDSDAKKGSGMNDDRTPTEIAKEMGKQGKKQKKAYRKQLKRNKKGLERGNKKKQKALGGKIKTKKISRRKDKSDSIIIGPAPKQ